MFLLQSGHLFRSILSIVQRSSVGLPTWVLEGSTAVINASFSTIFLPRHQPAFQVTLSSHSLHTSDLSGTLDYRLGRFELFSLKQSFVQKNVGISVL